MKRKVNRWCRRGAMGIFGLTFFGCILYMTSQQPEPVSTDSFVGKSMTKREADKSTNLPNKDPGQPPAQPIPFHQSNNNAKRELPKSNPVQGGDDPTGNLLRYHRDSRFVKAAREKGFKKLPNQVSSNVTTFLYFVGPIRSSHSIIGTYIDAHEHVAVADEFNFFGQSITKPNLFQAKHDVVDALWEGSWLASNGGFRDETFKGYQLKVPSLLNGQYRNKLDLVGDKIGYLTVEAYSKNKKKFSAVLRKLHEWFAVKVIFVVRNPFDNIATLTLYDHIASVIGVKSRASDYVTKFKDINACFNRSENLLDSPKVLAAATSKYIKWIVETHQMISELRPDLEVVQISDFIRSPKASMRNLCSFLNLFCSEEYLEAVAAKTFKSESKSRYSIRWNREIYNKIEQMILQYPEYFGKNSFFD